MRKALKNNVLTILTTDYRSIYTQLEDLWNLLKTKKESVRVDIMAFVFASWHISEFLGSETEDDRPPSFDVKHCHSTKEYIDAEELKHIFTQGLSAKDTAKIFIEMLLRLEAEHPPAHILAMGLTFEHYNFLPYGNPKLPEASQENIEQFYKRLRAMTRENVELYQAIVLAINNGFNEVDFISWLDQELQKAQAVPEKRKATLTIALAEYGNYRVMLDRIEQDYDFEEERKALRKRPITQPDPRPFYGEFDPSKLDFSKFEEELIKSRKKKP